MIKIIECPRDAMQGIKRIIPTVNKANYLKLLLEVGFDTIDIGSFVSPKAIPQMADTADVLNELSSTKTLSKLLTIVANKRGAEDAKEFENIQYLGFPFSISETFQKRNTNKSIDDALNTLHDIKNICEVSNKDLVIYLSMAFGNPYEDKWNPDLTLKWTERIIKEFGNNTISLSDTIGCANKETILPIFTSAINDFKQIEIGAHFHTTPSNWQENVDSAYKAGCKRFDTAIKGYGGCPMAKDDLTGNLATEQLLQFLKEKNEQLTINEELFNQALNASSEIFDNYH